MVGRIIWGGHEVVGALNADNYLKAKVIWLQGVNDSTLNWLYKNCLFTVYPSLYEGWGLPVAESLIHGKFCISSDGGSLSEVGPGFVEYISPLDFIGWYRALVKYCFYPNLLSQKTQHILDHYQPTTWSFTANQVMSALKRIPISPKIRLEPLTIGKTIYFTEKTPDGAVVADKFKLGGWSPCESIGSWSDGTRAILGLQLDQKPTLPLALRIDANGYVPNDVPVQVTMIANGITLARWLINTNPTILYTLIPAMLIDISANLRIEFLIANPRIPQLFDSKSTDQRLLGIKIQTISLHMLMQLNLNTWSDTPESDATNIIINGPTNDPNTRYLGLAIDPGESTALEIEINDKKIYSFTTLSGENCIKLIHRNLDIFGKSDLFSIKLIAKDNGQPQLTQVGLFTKPLKVTNSPVPNTYAPFDESVIVTPLEFIRPKTTGGGPVK